MPADQVYVIKPKNPSKVFVFLNELVDVDNADTVIRRAGQPLVVGPKFTATGGNGRRQVQGIGGLQAMAGAQLGG